MPCKVNTSWMDAFEVFIGLIFAATAARIMIWASDTNNAVANNPAGFEAYTENYMALFYMGLVILAVSLFLTLQGASSLYRNYKKTV